MNILQAMDDPNVFASHFRGSTWVAWRVFLAALFGLRMKDEERALFQAHTGRTTPPAAPSLEAWLVCGRRAGKSFILALVAVFLAVFKDWRPFLGPGEIGTVMIIAADRKQARVIMRYCLALLDAVPMLKRQIEATTQESITLKNRITLEVHTANFRSVRGYTVVAALLDELAFWPVDENSASPDIEVINALRPAMATVPGAMLLCASSPYARKGSLWDAYRKHYAKNDDRVLVWQAATRDMNPSVLQSYIDEHMADDPARASAEYMAQFRTDIESFISREAVEACIAHGVRERAPEPGVTYGAFTDPGGGRVDSMTLAIAHRQGDLTIIDVLRERKPPLSPEDAVAEFATLLKSYRISKITGDSYGGEWPRERFRNHGILYEAAPKTKSDLYRDLLPAINSRQVELLDDARLVGQIVGLERRTGRGGRDSIDHAPGGHDDLANAVAGVVSQLNKPMVGAGVFELYRREYEKLMSTSGAGPVPPPGGPNFGWNFYDPSKNTGS